MDTRSGARRGARLKVESGGRWLRVRDELNAQPGGPKFGIAPTCGLADSPDAVQSMHQKIKYYQILILLILSACSASGTIDDGPRESASDLNYRGSDCILIPTIRDYTPLDNQHLLIRGSGRRAYFVTLFGPAFDMRGAIGLRVDSRDDQLCPYGGDAIVFGSFADERVNVASISRITAEQEEQLLFRYGRKEPVEPAAPAEPVDIAGAEVEELG